MAGYSIAGIVVQETSRNGDAPKVIRVHDASLVVFKKTFFFSFFCSSSLRNAGP
jgi:hypothetical protein